MSDQLLEKSYRALEYDRVLETLAGECSCPDSAALAQALRPGPDAEQAKERLLETEDACRLSLRFGGPSFFGLKNIDAALSRAKIGSSLVPGELLEAASVLYAVRSLARYRQTTQSESTCLDARFDALAPNKYLEEKITSAIVSEEEIADAASSELAAIRRRIKRCGAGVREQLDRMIRSPAYQKLLQDPIVTIRAGRFVVPVKAEFRGEVPGLVHDTSASGATVFVEPMSVVESNNELKVLYAREEKEIERILAELSAEVGGFADSIADSYRKAVELDFIFARARLAFKMKASAPQLGQTGGLYLHKARHPMLDAKTAVPVDIRLGEDFDTLVVTGPNTGGKTVALKTLGLLSLMAMSGLMIPAADDSRVLFFDRVLADIGDEQSIEQSLSTFSAHMTNIIEILRVCGEKSLVLLDELGSGTDPVEGAALATSILEYLRERGAKVAATTHYAELKAYALQTPGVENACCEFDLATLRPTYRLLIGVPGRSNAFAISERLGLPGEIIARARQSVSAENTRFEDVVQDLESSRQQMEKEREEAARLRAQAQKASEEAKQLKSTLEAEKEREIEDARRQARRLLEQSRAQARQLLDELDELRKMKNTEDLAALRDLAKSQIGARLKTLENQADPVREKKQAPYRLPRPLKPGDLVLLTDIDKKATVIEKPDGAGHVEVQAGIIRTRVPVTSLRLLGEAQKETQRVHSSVHTNIDRSRVQVKSELDLRGQTVDEALLELDRFIDNAQLAGISLISVIHGKGTGALRAAVQQHLRSHAAVKSFRLGRYGEGETGVTIIELK
jgi:DNA mismatch repair protein MutS2